MIFETPFRGSVAITNWRVRDHLSTILFSLLPGCSGRTDTNAFTCTVDGLPCFGGRCSSRLVWVWLCT